MNDISATLFYGTRLILSAPIETPVTWHCSKVEQTAPKGVSRITFAQEQWDEHKDAFEYEDGDITSLYYSDKKVVGMWADYFDSEIEPKDVSTFSPTIYGKFTYSAKPLIKIAGSYKKFTLTFYDGEDEIDFKDGAYEFTIDGEDAISLVSTIVEDNVLKIKFNGDDTYIGKTLQIRYVTEDGIEVIQDVKITAL